MDTEILVTPAALLERTIRPLDARDLGRSLVDRFDDVVAEHPHKIAIRSPREAIGYGDLKARSERIACFLRERGGHDGAAVVTLLPQGIDAIVAQLGILRAGGFYVPADARESRAQLPGLARQAGASLVISEREAAAWAREDLGAGVDVVEVAQAERKARTPACNPHPPPDALAYLYFTSGSTGAPKGVADTHRNVLHNVLRYTQSLAIGADDRLTLLQPPSFSGAVSSTYAALLNGGTLLPYDLHEDGPEGLARFIAEHRATIYHSVPSIFRNFIAGRADFPAMRFVRLEGDRALGQDARLFQQHFRRGCRLVNGLGTTETGLVRQYFVTHDTVVDDGPLPIGYPVVDVECLIVDERAAPVPAGATGEIMVVGRFLAPGYWRDAALTRRKFVSCGNSRGYRTGDLGRLRADGCLEYLGRSQGEARIRGVTIDPSEIEGALLHVAGVRDAAVAIVDRDGDLTLVAAVATLERELSTARLRAALVGALPAAAIPARFVVCDALPLSAYGKVDRAAVARMVSVPEPAVPKVVTGADGDEVDHRLAEIWRSVLGLAVLDSTASFLEQGGDSLRAMQILLRVHETFGVHISPLRFFALASLADQAAHVRERLAEPKDAPLPTRGGTA